jgi:ABC-type transporter Mla subunit MlaD
MWFCNLNKIQHQLDKMEKILMAIQEDFKAFISQVNTLTNQIGAALATIQADIKAIATDPDTPPDIAASLADSATQLGTVSSTAQAIAAGNQPVVPPPPAV